VWYMVRNVRRAVTIDTVLANSKSQNAFLFPVHAMFGHYHPLAAKSASTPRRLVHKTLPTDVLLSAVSVLVAAQRSSDVPEGLRNYPVFWGNPPSVTFFPLQISHFVARDRKQIFAHRGCGEPCHNLCNVCVLLTYLFRAAESVRN